MKLKGIQLPDTFKGIGLDKFFIIIKNYLAKNIKNINSRLKKDGFVWEIEEYINRNKPVHYFTCRWFETTKFKENLRIPKEFIRFLRINGFDIKSKIIEEYKQKDKIIKRLSDDNYLIGELYNILQNIEKKEKFASFTPIVKHVNKEYFVTKRPIIQMSIYKCSLIECEENNNGLCSKHPVTPLTTNSIITSCARFKKKDNGIKGDIFIEYSTKD